MTKDIQVKQQMITTTDLMTPEEKEKRVGELKSRLTEIQRETLPGKCPIRFFEIESEKIDWENPILREPYNTWKDALKSLTATTDPEIAGDIFNKGLNALPGNNVAKNANLTAQMLADNCPADATEAKLCVQEMALYAQGMQYLYRAENCDMLTQREFYLKSAIKLLRLHNETIETRGKYRRGGEQRVVVQHVQVNDGGKAIVGGNLAMTGGGGNKK